MGFKQRWATHPGRFIFIDDVGFKDPETGGDVHIEVWKDTETGGIFGIDSSFLEQVSEHYNPFTGEVQDLPDP